MTKVFIYLLSAIAALVGVFAISMLYVLLKEYLNFILPFHLTIAAGVGIFAGKFVYNKLSSMKKKSDQQP